MQGSLYVCYGKRIFDFFASLIGLAILSPFPQPFNVLVGDMSIVGPRPEVEKYIRLFENDYKDILKVKPGITDYATIEFSDEEAVLKKYENTEDGYVAEVLPRKIKLYKKFAEISFLTDVRLIGESASSYSFV